MPIVQMIEPRRGPTTFILAFSRRTSSAGGQCRAGTEGRGPEGLEDNQQANSSGGLGQKVGMMRVRARALNDEAHARKASLVWEDAALLVWSLFLRCAVCGFVVCGSLSVSLALVLLALGNRSSR